MVTTTAPPIRQFLQSSAPLSPVVTTQMNRPVYKPRGRPPAGRGRGARAVQITPKTVGHIPTSQVIPPIVIAPTSAPVPPYDLKPRIVVDTVQEVRQEPEEEILEEEDYNTDELADVESESEQEEVENPQFEEPEIEEEQ